MSDIFIFIIPILGIGVLQGVFISYILAFLKKGNKKASFMLMLVVLVYTGEILTSFLAFSGLYTHTSHFFLIFYPLGRIIGPVYYLFVVLLLDPKRGYKWYDLLHLIPMFYLVYQMIPFYTLPTEYKIKTIEYLWFSGNLLKIPDFMMHLLWQVHTIFYIGFAIRFLRKKSKRFKEYTSNTFIDFIDWLEKFTNIFLLILIVAILGSISCFFIKISGSKSEVVINLIITFYIHYIAFTAIRQPQNLFFVYNKEANLKVQREKTFSKNRQSIMPLLELVEREKLYLDPNLKVHHIATLLEMTPHQVSKLINSEKGVNFYTFINQYRVDEFKKRIDSNQYDHMTLLGIAQSVGFNSKSSFNRIFKSHTDMTPSEYHKLKKVPSSNIRSSH